MFAAEFEPAQNDGRRRSTRAPVSLEARVSGADTGPGGIARTLCKVVDISIHGCRLRSYSALRKGSTIWLTLPHVGPVAADVMWADDFAAGCQFRKPLTPEQYQALADPA